jgi:hypothetical protein
LLDIDLMRVPLCFFFNMLKDLPEILLTLRR